MPDFRETRRAIAEDLRFHGGTSFFHKIRVYLFNPSFRILLNYRLGRYFFTRNRIRPVFSQLAAYYQYRLVTKRNCQISYKAILGQRLFFPHPLGVVIGEQVIVGDDVMIWQHVTLGSHGKPGQIFQYPVIGDKVKIFTGSTIIGDVKIGENAIVGAASVVLRNVPAEARVAGIPAKELEKRP